MENPADKNRFNCDTTNTYLTNYAFRFSVFHASPMEFRKVTRKLSTRKNYHPQKIKIYCNPTVGYNKTLSKVKMILQNTPQIFPLC